MIAWRKIEVKRSFFSFDFIRMKKIEVKNKSDLYKEKSFKLWIDNAII